MGDKLARKLEQALNKPYGWMDRDHEDSLDRAPRAIPQVPLLDMAQALRHLARPGSHSNKSIPLPVITSHLAFAMSLCDDSMSVKFQAGDIIVVDPAISPTASDFVLAIQNDNPQTLVLRQLIDNNGRQLAPTNPAYATHKLTSEDKIVGKVIYRGEIF